MTDLSDSCTSTRCTNTHPVSGFAAPLLISGILTSAFNIIPALVIPLFFGAALVAYSALLRRDLKPLAFISGLRGGFIVFAVLSIVYAAAIGVDVWNPGLYRREFKFVVPFSYFIIFSAFFYHDQVARAIKYALIATAFFSLAWLIFGLVDPAFASRLLYPYRGHMWEYAGTALPIYLGPFMTHSAAGGFYATLAFLQLGILIDEPDTRIRRLAIASLFMAVSCLVLTGSRAFLLASFSVSALSLAAYVSRPLRRRCGLSTTALIGASGIAGIGVMALAFIQLAPRFLVSPPSSAGPGSAAISAGKTPTRAQNVDTRLRLWRIAASDFLQSPIIGVGASRFDDDPRVLSTIPIQTRDALGLKINWTAPVSYLHAPLVRINVSRDAFHTDQEAHNVYLNVLAEGGVVFFAIFVGVYTALGRRLYHVFLRGPADEKGLARGTLYALAMVAVASFFGMNLFTVIPMVTILSVAAFLLRPRTCPSPRS